MIQKSTISHARNARPRMAIKTTPAAGPIPAAKAMRAAKSSGVPKSFAGAIGDFVSVYRAQPMQQVDWVKQGVPATEVEVMARRMSVSKERLFATLGLARATVDRKARNKQSLSADESSRVLGMARLVGQVQAMVEESGNPKGFDSAQWVAHWLELPLPALAGVRPAQLMDTAEGQGIVSNLLARVQSGAYA